MDTKRQKSRDKREKTQKTTKGHEIRVPKRADFYRDLQKAADPLAIAPEPRSLLGPSFARPSTPPSLPPPPFGLYSVSAR